MSENNTTTDSLDTLLSTALGRHKCVFLS